MYRNERSARSFTFPLILACGLVLTGCVGAVAARSQGGAASDAVAVELSALGPEQHLWVLDDGRDPYASLRDPGTGEFIRDIGTGELLSRATATPLGAEQHIWVLDDGRDPYASLRDPGTGEFNRDIGTGELLSRVAIELG